MTDDNSPRERARRLLAALGVNSAEAVDLLAAELERVDALAARVRDG